jgi:hypothetical protein
LPSSLDISTCMLNEGATALPYQPFDGSKVTIDCSGNPLHQVPNLVKNQLVYGDGGWKYIKNNQYKTNLLTTDFFAVSNGTNVQSVLINISAFAGLITQVAGIITGNFTIPNHLSETIVADGVGNEYKYSANTSYLYLMFPLGTFADITEVRNKFAVGGTNPLELVYQLATPIIIEEADFPANGIDVDGILSSNLDNTNFYADAYNILPETDIVYPANLSAGVASNKNAIESNKVSIDNLEATVEDLNTNVKTPLAITNADWVASGLTKKPFKKNVGITGVMATDWVTLTPTTETEDIAQNAAVAQEVTEYDGGVTIYALVTPSGTINVTYNILKG